MPTKTCKTTNQHRSIAWWSNRKANPWLVVENTTGLRQPNGKGNLCELSGDQHCIDIDNHCARKLFGPAFAFSKLVTNPEHFWTATAARHDHRTRPTKTKPVPKLRAMRITVCVLMVALALLQVASTQPTLHWPRITTSYTATLGCNFADTTQTGFQHLSCVLVPR
jgi:hypothetical protein